ncbi:MAG: hypothetical protein HYY44_03010 [Deltaproteobacteria bacterium]|nr:hypothetical protein [Deltaproteobacteria bacterium]
MKTISIITLSLLVIVSFASAEEDIQSLNKRAMTDKITEAETKRLCDWFRSGKISSVNTYCPKEVDQLKEQRRQQKEVLLKSYRQKYKKVIDIGTDWRNNWTHVSEGHYWKLNQMVGEWAVFAYREEAAYEHVVAVRRSTLPKNITPGGSLDSYTNYLGYLGEEQTTNTQGFPLKMEKYDAIRDDDLND